jgi:hypothetical protein
MTKKYWFLFLLIPGGLIFAGLAFSEKVRILTMATIQSGMQKIAGADTPRGIRNNNPGNLTGSDSTWNGQTGLDGRFCVFDTPVNGLRALMINALRLNSQGLQTLFDFGNTWAPPSDNGGKNTYGQGLASQLGVDVGDPFDLFTSSPFTVQALAKAITINENAVNPYDSSTFDNAAQNAVEYVSANPEGNQA